MDEIAVFLTSFFEIKSTFFCFLKQGYKITVAK